MQATFRTEDGEILERSKTYPLANKIWNLPKIPRDSEGFVRSFQPDDVQGYMEFFQLFGFVVIDNILTKDETNATIDEIWNFIEKDDEVSRDDPRTWTNDKWPAGASAGFISMDVAQGTAGWSNRQNKRIYDAFSNLIEDKQLWVSIDRYGIMRPTKNIPMKSLPKERFRTWVESDGEKVDIEGWRSVDKWTHWDLNPWNWTIRKDQGREYQFEDFISENNGTKNYGTIKLQGVINLTDVRENDGGFCCVPGFHHKLQDWSSLTLNSKYDTKANLDLVYVPPDDSIHGYLEKIPARAGSLIVWRSELPHCNFSNSSNRFRMTHYIKFFQAQEGAPGTRIRKSDIKKMIPPNFEISPLGKKLFGLESWNTLPDDKSVS